MKKLFLIVLGFLSISVSGFAQRYAVIDTKYILNKLPEYKEAQKKLDLFSEQWQKEIEGKQAELDVLYRNFEAEQVMLSDQLKKKREDELFNKEKEL
ncbi:MAG: OmpH family outer membrane protein, partial [Sphingobacteriales bacterium]